jgi:hypothetical protein
MLTLGGGGKNACSVTWNLVEFRNLLYDEENLGRVD